MAQCGDNSGQPSGVANQWASPDIQSDLFLFHFVTPRFVIRFPIPSLVPHFSQLHTHTLTLTHFLRVSPSVRVLRHSSVSFHSCGSTIVSALNPCVSAVVCCLLNASHRETTPCVRVRLVSHHSPNALSVSGVPSLTLRVALLGLFVPASASHTLSKLAHGLTHSCTRSLTYLLTPRAVYFLMVTSAHVAPSASETRLLLHHRRTATEAS